ncbi:trypsin-like serine peptidase [Frigidibacter sp. MR17.24]|uniref:trypsin-like serine peptidase n=1 Tax=Frigidibacter sp. MR17.24 TaxID=3127345 RepID=UPI003012E818
MPSRNPFRLLSMLALGAGLALAPGALAPRAGAQEAGSQDAGSQDVGAGEGAAAGPLRELDTADDTRGWEAVGRIDLGGRGFCTGSLIAPDLVLTAAHCLYDKTSGARFEAAQLKFLAGWRQGRAAAYRDVRRAIGHPDYVFTGSGAIDKVGHDLALLELAQPIRLPSITPYETDPHVAIGDRVAVVSYALDRAEAPSLQDRCRVLDRQDAVLITSCSVDFGSSGSPIFSLRDGVARIVSVVSAKAEMEGRPVALGTDLDAPLSTLKAELAGTLYPVSGMVFRRGAGEGAASGGAKFLRP